MATTWSYVRPNNNFESPFWAKHRHMHLPFLRQNNSSLVEHLYRLTTDQDNHTAESREKLWVLCNPPFERACLKLREIQESLTLESPLGVDCFNLAVRNLVAEDADNFQHTKCMGWRHVYQVCKMDSTRADEYSCPEFTSSRFACDDFGAHLVLIPVVHDGDWSLYAFNMCDRKLSILDSSSLPYPEVRHRKIRRKISGVVNETLATLSDGSQDDICSWECQFPMVPTKRNRNDGGYFVFNFMRLWDGHQLAQSFPEH
ncbi:uncharacterized protein [Miscanthus floridulus]|uniref:uncharacterized protein n=1 Tax=Miscanthus floridulus TaxID=154761 RepID=UPI003457AC50